MNIVLADDDNLVRTGIKRLLEDIPAITIVGEASNGLEAVALVRKLKPQLVLLDLRMPKLDGLAATRKLIRFDPKLKIIIITGCQSSILLSRIMKAGAVGYITKNASFEELYKAIRIVKAGGQHLSSDLVNQLVWPEAQISLENLTDRELEVALMMAEGEKISAIAQKLHLTRKTISGYKARVFEKLQLQSGVDLTHRMFDYRLLDFKMEKLY